MELVISVLIGSLVLLVVNIFRILLGGIPAKRGEMEALFKRLSGIEETARRKSKLQKNLTGINRKQYLTLFIPVSGIAFVFSLVFFRNLSIALVVTILSSVYPYFMINERNKKRRRLLNYQFRDALQALASSLKAGSSLNNALIRTHKDLERIYTGRKDKPIVEVFAVMAYELELMIPVEDVLINFMNRTQLEDITDFVNVTLMTRRQGGNLTQVISRVARVISDRIEVEHEINTLVAGKKMEAKVLTGLPVILVFLLSMLSPEYMKPMYSTTLGKFLMLLASLLLVANYFVGKKIIDIEV